MAIWLKLRICLRFLKWDHNRRLIHKYDVKKLKEGYKWVEIKKQLFSEVM